MADGHVIDRMPPVRRRFERYMDKLDVACDRRECGMSANCEPIVFWTADEQFVAIRPRKNWKVARREQRAEQYIREVAPETRTPEDDEEEDRSLLQQYSIAHHWSGAA